VLVVDDDRQSLRLCETVLVAAGFVVTTTDDGERASRLIEDQPFDVVLSDIVMPGLDGLNLLERVRRRDLDLPVVLMTSNPDLQGAIRAVEWGALRYLVKPVPLQTLERTVAEAARLHQMAYLKRELLASLGANPPAASDRAGNEARFAIAIASLRMAYQPIVAWPSRKVYAYEALLRTAETSFQSPGDLIEVAARLGKLHVLGRAVRASVARTLVGAPAGTRVFVNVHPRDLLDEDLYAADAPLTRLAERVVLEITERATLDDVDRLPSRIESLKRRGFGIALDDLGAGYSGLSSFAALEPTVVKFDMSLVRGIDAKPTPRRIIQAMAALFREMGKLVVAEGVETTAERDALAECGCDYLQGFLLGRPGAPFPALA
jgi:EAL domain-containing protein (putative c-di-GMP-specific phosphodiesterase class I)/ActR/RegA family two-component response regulator